MTLISQGIDKKLISFDDEQKYIYYLYQNVRRLYSNPEEKIQAETFLKLVLEYGYPVQRIKQYVAVTVGSSKREADVIVYKDDACTQPFIVVECKNQDISELEFKEAVKQAFSYGFALAGTTKFIWVTKGNKEEFYRFDKDKDLKLTESNIPYFGETDTKKYKYAKGGFYIDKVQGQETKIKTGDIQAVSENELTRVFKQAHDALWAGGELNPSQAFDELDKLIFCKVWDEKNTKKGLPYQFQIVSEFTDDEQKNLAALKKRITDLYDNGKTYDPEIFNKPIDLSAERIKSIVEYFQGISFFETDLDSKGKAFETFLGTYFRGEFGQFFTPRNVVKFAVDVLPITHKSRVLDTSCGSGGFLLYCLDKVRRQAEQEYDMNIPKEAVECFNQWHDFAQNRLFGIEINDQISRVAKMNMIIHDDGHTNVITFDGLFQINYLAKHCNGGKGNSGFAENSFDFIVTNPPFGSIVKQSEKAYMQSDGHSTPYYAFSLKDVHWIDVHIKGKNLTTGRENQSTEILFIEQCHKFLKPGGYLGIVIPDGILTNSSAQYVRDGIEEKFRIVAVVSLPPTTFTNTGAGVKSSILFLKKHDEKTTANIREIKQHLQDDIATQADLVKFVERLEKDKKAKLKPLVLQYEKAKKKSQPQELIAANVAYLEELKVKDEEIKLHREAISQEYTERLNAFKEELEERYQAEKQVKLPNYPIFMAIAEFIGFDATGRTIPQNDLIAISEELQRFIAAIEEGTDANFFLSLSVDKNKIFLVQKGEIEWRLDSNTYHPERTKIIYQLKKTNWQLKSLKFVANFPKIIVSINPENLPYIGLENIESNTGVYIETSEKESFGTAVKFKENQVLFPKLRPYLNKVHFANFKGLCSTEFHILDSKLVDNRYLAHFLRLSLVVNQTKYLMSGNTLPRLQTSDIENLLIPILPEETQQKIINIFESAYNSKQHQEAEAAALLASIDAYLLQALGITLPPIVEKKKVFYTSFKQLSGGRFDPFYHQTEFEQLEQVINQSPFKKTFLHHTLIFLESGSRPSGGVSQYESGILSLGGEHINDKCEVEIKTTKYVPVEYHKKHLETETKLYDVLLVKDGATTGKIGIITNESHVGQNINEHVFMMRFNKSVSSFFILNLLAMPLYQKLIGRVITGATVTGLTKDVVKSLKIPLPPIEIQTQIANHISAIRQRAKQLQHQATAELEQAKQRVEKMILGE